MTLISELIQIFRSTPTYFEGEVTKTCEETSTCHGIAQDKYLLLTELEGRTVSY